MLSLFVDLDLTAGLALVVALLTAALLARLGLLAVVGVSSASDEVVAFGLAGVFSY